MTLVESLKKFLAKLGGDPNDLENNATSAEVIDAISEAYTDKEGTHTEVNPIVTTGTKIATITTNNVEHDIYAPIDSSSPYTLYIQPSNIEYDQYNYPTRSYTFARGGETNIQEVLTTIAKIPSKDKLIISDMYNHIYNITMFSCTYKESTARGMITIHAQYPFDDGLGNKITVEIYLSATKNNAASDWEYSREFNIEDTQQVTTYIKKVDNVYRLQVNTPFISGSSGIRNLTINDFMYGSKCYGVSYSTDSGKYSHIRCIDNTLGGGAIFQSTSFECTFIPKSTGGYTYLIYVLIYFKGYIKNGTSDPVLKEWYYTARAQQDSAESLEPISLTRVDVT